MRNKKGSLLILAGALLLMGALGLTGYNIWDENRAARSADTVLRQMEELIPLRGETDLPGDQIPDHILAPNMEMPTLEVEQRDYIGYISIPAIGTDLPVMAQWSYADLKEGPCRYAGSAYLDDLVVCAHNYSHHFGRLSQLQLGDTVEFTDVDGNLFTYAVAEKEQLEPDQAKLMLSGDWDLSLFTCTLGGQYRTTIRCERVEEM